MKDEWVIIVVPQYTQILYQLLVQTKCVPRSYHLEGRYGSRTHEYYEEGNDIEQSEVKCDDKNTTIDCDTPSETLRKGKQSKKVGRRMIGIPVLLDKHVHKAIESNEELRKLFDNDTKIVYLIHKPYVKSKRQHEPPVFDAQIHPERCRLRHTDQDYITLYKRSYVQMLQEQQRQQDRKKNFTKKNDINTEYYWYDTLKQQSATSATYFTYGELFAGIGGFAVALNALGGTCIFCSEINETCQNVYNNNFLQQQGCNDHAVNKQQHGILHGDIYQVLDEQLPKPGTMDLLVGGFPCQPFSSLGDQPGFNCPDGNLFLQIVRVLTICQPKSFLFENVPGLLQMPETVTTIVTAFEQCGYNVTMEICDARCLTATTRKRLYIVGLSNRQNHQPSSSLLQEQQLQAHVQRTSYTLPNNSSSIASKNNVPLFQFPYIPDLKLRAQHVIEYDYQSISLENGEVNDADLLHVSDEQLHRLNTEKYWKPAHLAWPNTVIDTLVSHYGKSISRGHSQMVPCSAVSVHAADTNTTNPRRFTPRECARIMGFPRTFILPPKTNTNQCMMAYYKEFYQMFGNAVCPPIIAAISGAILDHCCSMELLQLKLPPPAAKTTTTRTEPNDSDDQKLQENVSEHIGSPPINDWVDYGIYVAIQLAYDALLLEKI